MCLLFTNHWNVLRLTEGSWLEVRNGAICFLLAWHLGRCVPWLLSYTWTRVAPLADTDPDYNKTFARHKGHHNIMGKAGQALCFHVSMFCLCQCFPNCGSRPPRGSQQVDKGVAKPSENAPGSWRMGSQEVLYLKLHFENCSPRPGPAASVAPRQSVGLRIPSRRVRIPAEAPAIWRRLIAERRRVTQIWVARQKIPRWSKLILSPSLGRARCP